MAELEQEANFALTTATELGLPKGAYLACDYEPSNGGRIANISQDQASSFVRRFCEIIESAGYKPIIYGNAKDLVLIGEQTCSAYPVWLASYTTENPLSPIEFVAWQYTNCASIQGIDGEVDVSLFFTPLE